MPDDSRVETKVLNDRYELRSRIGSGGMGAVYHGQDQLIGRHVAVKELRQEYSTDDLIRKRFLREARAAGGLSHPHIVTVFDLVESDRTLYIVMEYLEGGTLLDRMSDAPDGRLEVQLALEVGRQALLGLDALHRAGLVHRDIKPGNLIFDAQGTCKIADFGVVHARDEDDVTSLTRDGGHPGTLVYMAPEQIDGAEVEGRSDVYSLASVLYEALAGVRYFERPGLGRTERALMDAICDLPPIPLRQHVPYVSAEIETLIGEALKKNVDDRPSASEMAEAIGDLLSMPRAKPRIERPDAAPGTAPGTPELRRSGPSPQPTSERRRSPTAARGSEALPGRPGDPYAETRPGSVATPARHPPLPELSPQAPEPEARSPRPATKRPPTTPLIEPPARARTADPPAQRPTRAESTPAGASTPPSSTASPSTRTARRERDAASIVRVPAGTFFMGSDESSDELPAREVTLESYTIDRLPVTVGRYRRFLEAIERQGPPVIPLIRRLFPDGKDHRPQGWGSESFEQLCPTDDHPVVLVDWFDALAYAHWAGARLPTEAEWERAARGGQDRRPYPWGDLPVDDTRAIFGRRTYGPEPVGSRPAGASPGGVLDLVGNVWEWCRDRYDPNAYKELPATNPHLAMTTDRLARAVKRGGSWTNSEVSIRVSKRGSELLTTRRDNLGFRCAGN